MFDYPALFRLDGRRALGVGARSGVGKTNAEALAAFGARVTCADVDLASAERTAAAIRAAGHEAAALRVGGRDTSAVTAPLRDDPAVDIPPGTPRLKPRKPLREITHHPVRP